MPLSASQPPIQPVVAVDEDQREADDDGRDRERQVDERVEQRACRASCARTSSSARPTPKTVFSGTAIAAMLTVSQNACMRRGRRHGAPDGAEPVLEGAVEDHRRRAPAAGAQVAERAARAGRSASGALALMSAPPTRLSARMASSTSSESTSSTTRHGRRAGGVVALDLAEDEDRRDLGLERDVARDQHDRAELADGAGEGERRRRTGSAGQRGWAGRSARKTSRCRAPSDAAASSISRSSSMQHRLHRAHDERQRHEQQRERRRPRGV